MSYAVLTVADFALHARRRHDPGLDGRPVALLHGEGRRAVLAEISPEANGLEPGLAVTLALARCPGLVLCPRDCTGMDEAGRLLTATAFTLSPRVEATAPDTRTIDLAGAHPAQTTAALEAGVAALSAAGLPAQGGLAATPRLALYAARHGRPICTVRDVTGLLRDLPLAWAEPDAEQAEVLGDWGITTLGALAALAPAEVGRRLGAAGLALWERATGAGRRPLDLVRLPVDFAAGWTYEPPVESLQPLLFRLQRHAECLAAELRAAGLVAAALTLTLTLEDATAHARDYPLAEPGTQPDTWLKVMLSHLEGLHLPARLAAAHLRAQPARAQARQDGLFDSGLRDPLAFGENLSRLTALLGADRVGTPVPVDTWQPDRFILEPPARVVPAATPPPVHAPLGGVLRRFRPPRPVEVEWTRGRPVHVHGAVAGPVMDHRGPWRVSGGWWGPETWAVETWHVALATGVFQLARGTDGWVIEGEID
ncbi:MAG: hypothetical protein RIS54_1074 [Verrucomicrobiota bacterium]|jgi:protein ImuB